MHRALYRKWRPQTFDDVYGQEHITSVLKYETENNKFSHAYLFCGSRGTGKTTCAKILAKAVNCEHPVGGSPCNECHSCRAIDAGTATDVLEMDAASNNGVDNIRDIRDEVVYTPSALKYRVYIVDEVHMLTGSAFNALLKTLEEPPAHVIFILATTELHKLPATIISRCQRFEFRRISTENIMDRLSVIASGEGIHAEKSALRLIAKYAQGGMRDAISLLELCAGSDKAVTDSVVADTIGAGGSETISRLLCAVAEGDYDTIFGTVDNIVSSSKDLSVFWQDMISYCRDILVFKTTSKPDVYLDLTDSEKQVLSGVAARFTKETILYFLRLLDESLYMMQKVGAAKRSIAEMTLIRMGDESLVATNDALLSRISKLETAAASGNFVSGAHSVPAVPVKESPTAKAQETREESVKADAPQKAPDGVVQKKQNIAANDNSADKPLRGWQELAAKITATDPSVAPFLKKSRAYVADGNRVNIRFGDEFAKMMFEKSGLSGALYSVLSGTLKCELNENSVSFSVSAAVSDDDTELDGLPAFGDGG